MPDPADTVRLGPPTSTVHLEFIGGEDATVELIVVDRLDVPVPLASALGTIATPRCPAVHTWSVAAGNLRLGQQRGQVFLDVTAEQTRAWASSWGDSEWQLDTVDVFGHRQVPVEGDVRVYPTRYGGPS